MNKKIAYLFLALILLSACYRLIQNRPLGFAPQLAIALFSGMLFAKNKKLAFALPLLSMFVSDVLFQILYRFKLTDIAGFYHGQLLNYVLISATACIGFVLQKEKWYSLIVGSIAAPTIYFITSNFVVWLGGGGWYVYPKTFAGILECYVAGLPFYYGSIFGTFLFTAVIAGTYVTIKKYIAEDAVV